MNDIPIANEEMQIYWEAAGGENLAKYGEFIHIDQLAQLYNYSHEEAFNLSWTEAMTMISLNKERNYYEYRTQEIKRAADKK